jgi:hypothetical protein
LINQTPTPAVSRHLGSRSFSFVVALYKSVGIYFGSYMFEWKIMVKIPEQWNAASDQHGDFCNNHLVDAILF